LVVVASPSHPIAGRGQVAPNELAHERFLIREPSSETRRFIEMRFGQIGIQLQYGLELNNNEAIKALVASNWAFLSCRDRLLVSNCWPETWLHYV
jgi:DNA-binding transcriptional LysR family regulator